MLTCVNLFLTYHFEDISAFIFLNCNPFCQGFLKRNLGLEWEKLKLENTDWNRIESAYLNSMFTN